MSDELDYGLAFLTGILGGGHCIGMCGALVSACFVRLGAHGRHPMVIAGYHGARLAVYGLVGVLAAALGLALVSTGIIGKAQALLQVFAGTLVIILGFELLGLLPFRLPAIGLPADVIDRLLAGQHRRGPILVAAIGGLINGLMPCALTLAMAVKATTAANPLQGGLLMLVFGLGTVPAMLLVGLASNRIGTLSRRWILMVAGVAVIAMGFATALQGTRFFEVMRNLSNW
jgi:uncharacterized protein